METNRKNSSSRRCVSSFAEDNIGADYARVMAESIGPIARRGTSCGTRRHESVLADNRPEPFMSAVGRPATVW
jgi:hypothetical protein